MKSLITGHRFFKLKNYDVEWIKYAIEDVVYEQSKLGRLTFGLSGMASGVDLWFCESCLRSKIQYAACIPFQDQENLMYNEEEKTLREHLILFASQVYKIRNSTMVEKSDFGIVVWDGNKGGTHNVVQQLIEKKKDFIWINPVSLVVWECFN